MLAVTERRVNGGIIQLCLAGVYMPDCTTDRTIKIAIYLTVAVVIFYFIATLSLLLYKLRTFREQSYAQIQFAVVFYRLQVSRFEVE